MQVILFYTDKKTGSYNVLWKGLTKYNKPYKNIIFFMYNTYFVMICEWTKIR